MIYRVDVSPAAKEELIIYRPSHLWKHYWLIYQIYEKEQFVKIDYVIDDRQNYIRFIH